MRRLALILLSFAAILAATSFADAAVKRYKAVAVKSYTHDDGAYTQGLFFNDGKLYESTGVKGESSFRRVQLGTGEVEKKIDFAKRYFVEGSVMLGGNLYLLTWTNNVAFIYDAETLKFKQAYTYPREGWGLTTDGNSLISSDGSAKLYFMDWKFQTRRTVTVKLDGRKISLLNELEYIDGKIWANVYTSDIILIINPSDGRVEATVDCSDLLPKYLRDERTDVLNGIAFNPEDGKIYLTGKYWKRLFEIKLEELK